MKRCVGILATCLWVASTPLVPGQTKPMLWLTSGGAVGETARWSFHAQGNYVFVCSTRATQAAWGLMIAPPIHILDFGATSRYSTVDFDIPLPSDHRLAGSVVHLQAASNSYGISNLATWVVAASSSPRFRASNIDPKCTYYGPCRPGHARATLQDGTILFTGSRSYWPTNGPSGASPAGETHAQLYDPAQDRAIPVASMQNRRYGHVVQTLSDGTALVVGGDFFMPPPFNTNSAELYRPVQRDFIVACHVPVPFIRPLVAALQDPVTKREFVLIAGGGNYTGTHDAVL